LGDNIKINLKEIWGEGVNWILMAFDKIQWQALANMELTFVIQNKREILVTFYRLFVGGFCNGVLVCVISQSLTRLS
jgi:hypothetical protein